MKRATSWGLGLTAAVVLLVLLSPFIPRAGMISKPQAESSVPPVVSSAGYRSPGERHKISVSDRQLVAALKAQGARVIGDYGSFVLLEANDAVANSATNSSNAQIVDENNLILLNAGAIDTTTPAAQSRRSANSPAAGKQMHLIQFAGPIRPEWYQALVATGAHVVTYIPNNAYLVYGTSQTLQAVHQLAAKASIAQWDGEYTAAFRVDPAIAAATNTARTKGQAAPGKDSLPAKANLSVKGNEQFTIQMVEDLGENQITLALIEQFKLEPIIKQDSMLGYFNVRVALPRDVVISQIAKRGDVVSIQQWITPKKRDERQDIIISGNVTGSPAVPTPMDYLTYLAGKGFSTSTTAGFAVNLSDSGVDNATTTPNHFALYRIGDPTVPANSRIIYNRLQGTPNGGSTLQGCDGHGNENAHIICGYVPTGTVGGVNFGASPHADASGFRWDLGLAPFVKVGSSVIFDPEFFTSPTYQNLESQAYRDGARISSNSWGGASNTYTVDSQQYDGLVRDAQPDTGCSLPNCISTVGNQEYVIVFAAGNGGANGSNTVGEPSTAKNVITVGAAENVNPFGAADGCNIDDTGANNANDIIFFSSRGPTSDGRKKPDIMAPGTHVSSAVAQATIVSPTGSGTGAQLACFDGGGVCGGTGGSNFFPAGQQWYTASSGTSHATPAIAGVAALMRQYFINQALPLPSSALTKGLMMNSARYMTGVGANDSLPSNNQGMGEINLNSFFDIFTTAHSFHDEVPAETFTASGQQRVITGTVPDVSKPFRITLVWTDTPGPTSGNAFVNNLDLEVTVGGNTYKGNVFSGAFSATGGIADTRNNVESVVVPAGVTGSFVIKVKATNIAGDGVPNNAQLLDQDFALIEYNATESPLPVISPGATAITAESCGPANNAIDPTETVTVNFALSNIGTANTTSVVATLQPTGGVTLPSAPQNYGVLVANGPAATRPFTFTVGTTCAQALTATFQLQDGATNLGNVTFTFQTGALGAPVLKTYSSGNISTPIPDVSTVDIPINIVDTGVITDVNVRVRLNHTFDGDLVIQLVGPDGTIVNLAQNRGSLGDNYGSGATDCSGTHTVFDDSAATAISAGTVPFNGSFKPESPLSVFNGQTITGQWKLRVTDTTAQDSGTIFCVQLEITRQRFVCCGVPGTPEIASGGSPVITAESVSPANNAADPEETITVNLPVINIGDGNTTNLVGTLQATGGVNGPSGPQNYVVVVAGGPAVSRPFTFTAQGTCGSNITLTLALQDGATNLGTVTYTMTLGVISVTTTFSENFDGVVAPALPAGWVTAFTPIEVAWVTSATTPNSAPNDAFAPDVSNIGDTTLDTPTINVPATGGQLTFKNLYNMEGGFDGMVLEISINGGAFTDITTGGNAFITGGYNDTISSSFGSPIAGRMAWTDLSGGSTATPAYITSTINLPAGANGQPIKLRWRAATDNSSVAGGNPGVRIDNIAIATSGFVCNTQPCNITAPTSIAIPPGTCGTIVNYSPAVSFTGACGVVVGPNPPTGSFFGIGTRTVVVKGTRADNSVTDKSFPVTVQDSETQATGLGASVTNNYCNTTVTYTAVTGAGSTTVVEAPAQTLPPPYVECTSCPELLITTTASFTAPVTTCITMPPSTDFNTFSRLRILHGEPGLVNKTISSTFATKKICARTNTVSPFVVALDLNAPTAAPANISGKITTPDGAALAGVTMNLSGARSAKVITDSNGDYRFNNIDTDNFYTVTPALVNYHFGPESRSFSLLANKTDAVFAATRDAVVSGNAIDTADYFVRQHYLDFLGREPDESGFNFWSDQILSCGTDAACIERRTINVSAAYVLSIEFQQTGGLVDGLYRASYNRRPQYAEFMPDTGTVAQNLIVGNAGWEGLLEANKQAFVAAWVQRPAFQSAYRGLSNEAYVDTLISHAGAGFNGDRAKLVSDLNNGTATRADVLRQIAENEGFVSAKRNSTFVMMEYFGYLRRDPDASGYAFWLNKLNQFNGNFEQAEMVKAFLVSGEYRNRFRL